MVDRLFGIVYCLLDKKKMTAKELAARFEVSPRTILRDLDTLAAAGIPIYTTQGKGGGISLMEEFTLRTSLLSGEEQRQILFALESFSAPEYAQGFLLEKMRAIFRNEEAPWLEVDLSRWGNSQPDRERFETLRQSILQSRAIRVEYPGAYGKTTHRTLYPVKLVFKSYAWYLQAYCCLREDYRVFKLNRMLSIELEDIYFSRADYPPRPLEDIDAMPPGACVPLHLRFAPFMLWRVYDEFDAESVQRLPDGFLDVHVALPEDGGLYGFLLSFGSTMRVIDPPRVRENLLREMKKTRMLYET